MHSKDNLKRLPQLSKLSANATSKFWQYDQAALADGAIPKKFKELMAVAVALTTQCVYCIEVHKNKALEAGAAITQGTHLLSDHAD